MPRLNWISDKALIAIVDELLTKAKNAKDLAENKFGRNVIDPFSALFEITGFDIDQETWKKNETIRQAQKTLQNHIGDFHQKILGNVDGWENLHVGNFVDLISHDQKIIAEVKNKYNTVSGGKLADVYNSLEKLVMPNSSHYKGYTSYYVTILPKMPIRFDRPFTPSDRSRSTKCTTNELVREIDGSSFYTLVTKDQNALENLFDILPDVIFKCSSGKSIIRDLNSLKIFFNSAFTQKDKS